MNWIDHLATRLIGHAAGTAPEPCSERLHEEWLAHALELPAPVLRLRFALNCHWAAMLISRQGLGVTPVVRSAPTGEVTMTARTPRALPLFPREASADSASILCEINTTPLIDIMLVLLMTLIIVLPILTHGVKIELPQGAPLTDTRPQAVDLDIEFDGTVVWNGTALKNTQQLEDYFRAVAPRNPQPEIRLRPNRLARYDVVAKVLALAQRNQMKKVGFINTGAFQD